MHIYISFFNNKPPAFVHKCCSIHTEIAKTKWPYVSTSSVLVLLIGIKIVRDNIFQIYFLF